MVRHSRPITEIYLILGMRGFGKTTLAYRRILKAPRVITVDPLLEWDVNEWHERHPEGESLTTQETPDSLTDPDRSFYIEVPLSFSDPESTIERAAEMALTLENCFLAIDEADLKLDAMSRPPIFSGLVHTSRHWGVSILVTARRAAGLPTLLRSQATTIAVFRTRLALDRKYLKEETGQEPPGLATLPIGWYWRYRHDWVLIDKHGNEHRQLAPA